MEFSRCFQCMEETVAYPCPHCGYDPAKCPPLAYALQPGSILNGKYVVGTVLGQGGFGITYIGWDLALGSKVAIKEYFPSAQVSRTQSSQGTLQWYNTEAARTARESGKEMFLKEARKMSRVSDIPPGSPGAGSVPAERNGLYRHGFHRGADPESLLKAARSPGLAGGGNDFSACHLRHGADPSGGPDSPGYKPG